MTQKGQGQGESFVGGNVTFSPDGDISCRSVSQSMPQYAEIYVYEKSVPFNIVTANAYHRQTDGDCTGGIK